MSTSAPTPSPSPKLSAKTILQDVRLALGGIVTVGETILVALPAGPVHDAIAIALPAAAALGAYLLKFGE